MTNVLIGVVVAGLLWLAGWVIWRSVILSIHYSPGPEDQPAPRAAGSGSRRVS